MAFKTMLLMLTVGVVLSHAQKQKQVDDDDGQGVVGERDAFYSESYSDKYDLLKRMYMKHKVSCYLSD